MTATWSQHQNFPSEVRPLPERANIAEEHTPHDYVDAFGYVRYYNAEHKTQVGPQAVVYLWWPVPGGKRTYTVTAFSPRRQGMVMEHRLFEPDDYDNALAYARGLAVEVLAEMERVGLILKTPRGVQH